ncbi:MAG: (2Fe-2S)-binding protein [Bacteroidota bacterium]|nr:(2Fe-2S)-binding protein [Bacteroidota bacterium]
MPIVKIQNLFGKAINVAAGQTVLQAILEAGIDWMHACGAKGRCTTCRLIVTEGQAYFTALSAAEQKFRNQGRLKENERLLCQCMLPAGEVSGYIPEQTKFPHVIYSN